MIILLKVLYSNKISYIHINNVVHAQARWAYVKSSEWQANEWINTKKIHEQQQSIYIYIMKIWWRNETKYHNNYYYSNSTRSHTYTHTHNDRRSRETKRKSIWKTVMWCLLFYKWSICFWKSQISTAKIARSAYGWRICLIIFIIIITKHLE